MVSIEHRDVALTLRVALAGSGPPLVLVHGRPEYQATWQPRRSRRFMTVSSQRAKGSHRR